MNRAFALPLITSVFLACAPPARSPSPDDEIAPVAADVELRDGNAAVIAGREIPVDGVSEGLAWPALSAAVHRGAHAVVAMSVGRDVPVGTVLRAVWTLRDADVRVQTTDAKGVTRVLDLRPRPEIPSTAGCHLAVFVEPNGDLRVATPGGPHVVSGNDAAGALARALQDQRTECSIRYIAFGADDPKGPWGTVFDLARVIDHDKSAGDARYVLGEPIP